MTGLRRGLEDVAQSAMSHADPLRQELDAHCKASSKAIHRVQCQRTPLSGLESRAELQRHLTELGYSL